jgi:hypothetical protein
MKKIILEKNSLPFMIFINFNDIYKEKISWKNLHTLFVLFVKNN